MARDEEKDLLNVSENFALEEFDKEAEDHIFSSKYNQKRKTLKENSVQSTNKKKINWVAAAIILIVGIPSTAFGVKNFYEWAIKKDGYETNVSLNNNKEKKKKDTYYQLKLNQISDNFKEVDNHLVFKENEKKDGLIFNLWRINEDVKFKELFTESYEEKIILGHQSIIMNKVTGEHNEFNRNVYIVFEEEEILVEATVSKDVSNDDLENILKNISLEKVSEEKSDYIFSAADFKERFPKETPKEVVKGLPESSKNLYKINEKIHFKNSETDLSLKINDVSVFDNINQVSNSEFFNKESLEHLNYSHMLSEQGELLPYTKEEFDMGDGVSTVETKLGEKVVKPKFVYLEATVKNESSRKIEDTYLQSPIVYFEKKNKEWNYIDEGNKMFIPQAQTLNIDYFDDGKGTNSEFLNLESGETRTYYFGFFADEDKLNKMFLPVMPFGIDYDMMNLDDNRMWVDIRQ